MSEIKPKKWSCVIIGRWNPAILSPKGIATHIFNKKPDDPVEVLVPLDAGGPVLVKIEGMNVAASNTRLIVECDKNEWEFLQKAREYCLIAINKLPLTPLSAAGYNVRYEIINPNDNFLEVLKTPLDEKISDNGLNIEGRETNRALQWENGVVNLKISKINTSTYEILLNFDKNSTDNNELKEWILQPIETVCAITKKIMCDILNVCAAEEIKCPTPQNP